MRNIQQQERMMESCSIQEILDRIRIVQFNPLDPDWALLKNLGGTVIIIGWYFVKKMLRRSYEFETDLIKNIGFQIELTLGRINCQATLFLK